MQKKLSKEASREQLQEIKEFLQSEKERLKPLFGYMFWQFSSLSLEKPPADLLSEGLSLDMSGEADEIEASLMTIYVQLWDQSQDFTAASRLVASALGMNADELIQCRRSWLKNPS